VTQLEELVSKLSTFLHPHHYHLYSVKHSLVQLYGHQQGYQVNQLSDKQLERKAGMCQPRFACLKGILHLHDTQLLGR
jgi:hypothetical protein